MYSLYEQYTVVLQLYGMPLVLAASQFKVIARQLHLLAAEYAVEVGVELLKVESVKRFIVVIAVGVARSIYSVYEIIVKRYHLRFQQIGHQLYCQTLCSGGFARRRRTCHQHHTGAATAVTGCNLVADTGYFLVVQRLGHIYQVGCTVTQHLSVEFAHIAHAHNAVELHVVGKCPIHFLLSQRLRRHRFVGGVKAQQQHAFLVRNQVEYLQLSGRVGQGTIIAVVDFTEFVVRCI